MKILITGSSGLLGTALVTALTTDGHRVIPLRRQRRSTNEVYWKPDEGIIAPNAFDGIDAVIHLAGENIGTVRWTTAKKQRILKSRTTGTRLLCEHIARLGRQPMVLISASGAGIYGECGEQWIDETTPAGRTFMADVARQWEAATFPAEEAGVRVVHARFGIVLSRHGGALPRMLLPFKLGLGGKLGNGRQYISWISLADTVGILRFLLTHEELRGPVNITAPNPVTNAEFTKTLGEVVHRPSFWWVPAVGLRLLFGEMAQELLLTSTRVRPQKLLDLNYQFEHECLRDALNACVRK